VSIPQFRADSLGLRGRLVVPNSIDVRIACCWKEVGGLNCRIELTSISDWLLLPLVYIEICVSFANKWSESVSAFSFTITRPKITRINTMKTWLISYDWPRVDENSVFLFGDERITRLLLHNKLHFTWIRTERMEDSHPLTQRNDAEEESLVYTGWQKAQSERATSA
jgi:hypothetical protein